MVPFKIMNKRSRRERRGEEPYLGITWALKSGFLRISKYEPSPRQRQLSHFISECGACSPFKTKEKHLANTILCRGRYGLSILNR